MAQATVTSTDTDVVASTTRIVRVNWLIIRNTGAGASVAGVVQIRDATSANNVLCSIRTPAALGADQDWTLPIMFPISHGESTGPKSTAGLNIAWTSATNIAVEVGYD